MKIQYVVRTFILVLALVLGSIWLGITVSGRTNQTAMLAGTPTMGWSSWDSYGTTINEAEVKANADALARLLKPYGWQYVLVDMEWYVTNPVAQGNSKHFLYSMDRYGRYTPPASRFPSAAAGKGFKPLADYVHSLGLKFGIHILRGIPRMAVEKNLPIAGSKYHARDAADTSDTCPWNFDNYGVAANPAGEAYYDSLARLYAGWGVDYLKVDCICSHPYKGDAIRMISKALRKTGRPIVLSLSPGPAPIEKARQLRKYAQMWRVSNDIWDRWHSKTIYPQGVGDQFANAAKWAPWSGPGHWPDLDMLPLGRLGPAPGWGHARNTRLTRDEQRTLMTLWCIFRSPLMMGGNLTDVDPWTISLLTNPEVLKVDQHSKGNHPIITNDKTIVWLARPDSGKGHYVAIFNIADAASKLRFTWQKLGLPQKKYQLRDLWERKDLGSADSISVNLHSHGSVLYSVLPSPGQK